MRKKKRTLPWTSHECCGSRVKNRHLTHCPYRVPSPRSLPSDLQISVLALKSQGCNSSEVLEHLEDEYPELDLRTVNKLYA